MNARHLPLAIGVGFALFAGVRCLESCHREQDDEIHFQTMLRSERLPGQLTRWGFSIPNGLVARVTGFNLFVRYQQEALLLRANLDESGFFTRLFLYAPDLDHPNAAQFPWITNARQNQGLYSGGIAFPTHEIAIHCRFQDVPRWLALIPGQITNRLDYPTLLEFSRSGEPTRCHLPDGSTTDLAAGLRWLNESIDHGAKVAIARQTLPSGTNVLFLLRAGPAP